MLAQISVIFAARNEARSIRQTIEALLKQEHPDFEIVAVNDAIRNSPELLNDYPELGGWLFQIRLSNPHELETLMSRTDYQQLIGS